MIVNGKYRYLPLGFVPSTADFRSCTVNWSKMDRIPLAILDEDKFGVLLTDPLVKPRELTRILMWNVLSGLFVCSLWNVFKRSYR